MSLPHDSAHTHVTGESEFIDDRPIMRNELFADVIWSTNAHATIKSTDFSQVLNYPGVVAVYTGHQFKQNHWGTIFKDQPILATDKVQYAGEGIAIVMAESLEAAQRATAKAIIEYVELEPILSIQDAIKKKSFIIDARRIERGD